MTKPDPKKESCGCHVCRSDMAYVHPCAAPKIYNMTLPEFLRANKG